MEVGVLRATQRTIPAGTGVATVVQSAAANMSLASVAAILPDVALRLPLAAADVETSSLSPCGVLRAGQRLPRLQ